MAVASGSMVEVIEGLARPERERIAALRRSGVFFWVDVSLVETSGDDLAEALAIPGEALDPLVGFREDSPPSRKFYSDGQRVVFAFSCFLEPMGSAAATQQPRRPVEVHVLI